LKDQVLRCGPVNLADMVEIARVIKAQERTNSSYPVRSQPRQTQQVAPVLSLPRVHDRAQSKKPYEQQRHTNRASGSETTSGGEVRNTNPCRNCGDKWFQGHRCRQLKLKNLEVAKENDQEGPSGDATAKLEETEEQGEEEGYQTYSLGSLTDISRKKSMKLRGYIGNEKVVLLVDSRATCNFIDKNLVREMG